MADIRKMTHTVRKGTHTLTYWRDGVACGSEDDWTHVEMCSNIPFHSARTFKREELGLVLWIEAMLEDAYVIGRGSLKADIKALIN